MNTTPVWDTMKGHGIERGDFFIYAGRIKGQQVEPVEVVWSHEDWVYEVETGKQVTTLRPQSKVWAVR